MPRRRARLPAGATVGGMSAREARSRRVRRRGADSRGSREGRRCAGRGRRGCMLLALPSSRGARRPAGRAVAALAAGRVAGRGGVEVGAWGRVGGRDMGRGCWARLAVPFSCAPWVQVRGLCWRGEGPYGRTVHDKPARQLAPSRAGRAPRAQRDAEASCCWALGAGSFQGRALLPCCRRANAPAWRRVVRSERRRLRTTFTHLRRAFTHACTVESSTTLVRP